MKKLLSLSLTLLFLAGSFSSCKKNNGSAPALPPAASLTIDFNNFGSNKKSADIFTDTKGTNSSSWEFAASVASTWKLIIASTLAVPVTAFKTVIDEEPVFVSDKTWQWSYNAVSYLGITYKARLTGQIGANDVTWKMYVSADGTSGFPEFVWFEGTSKIDGTGGQWKFYQNAQTPVAYLQIDWTKTSDVIGTIKYTYIKTSDLFNTSYIEYGHITGTYNSYYTIHYWDSGKNKFVDVNVEWNSTTFNGRVKSTDYLNGIWYVWDINHSNV
jgi:hypothetical protein